MADALAPSPRPDEYKPPSYNDVLAVAKDIRGERQAKFDKITATKKAIRGDWEDVLRRIPRAYRKMQPDVDLPQVRDMIRRVVGKIAGQELVWEVTPPSARVEDVRLASHEEARFRALQMTLEDQQDESVYTLGLDSQCSWGESWISCWPDPSRFALAGEKFKRGATEPAKEYVARHGRLMADGMVPALLQVHDPQTVLPFFSRGRLALTVFESEHSQLDVSMGLGYKPVAGTDGKTREWVTGGTLSEPFVARDLVSSSRVVDTTHDSGSSGGSSAKRNIKSLIWVDPWVYQRYLDGVLVEQWEHDYGVVPVFPAWALVSSDNEPEHHSVGIVDTALVVARQIVYFSAVLAANAAQHGWPTPFLSNPDHGLVHPSTGKPLTREVVFGEMNLLGPNEKIAFPYLDGHMMPDFYRHMESLTRAFETSTLGKTGDVTSDTSGYAVAQMRALDDALLGPIYTACARQWRKIGYFWRHMVRTSFPAGLFLRGAVETAEVDGKEVQFRPVLEYAKEHTTDFAVNVHIKQGIIQDEIAERKSAIELGQAGYWSPRRVMEKTGVQDPAREVEEISTHRLLNSPAADQAVMQMGLALAAQRYMLTQQDTSSPFYQLLQKAQQEFAQLAGQAPANQGGGPVNANPGGQPMQQNPPPATPLEGGPTAGPPAAGPSQKSMGIPQLPGGVANQTPAVSGV
jgi:hypothetical protein